METMAGPMVLQQSGAGVIRGSGETPERRASFLSFWQDSARDNPIEIARVSAVLLFTQHNIRYVEYISKCLYYAELYPSFPPGCLLYTSPSPRD